MVNTSDFSEFVVQREKELQTEVLGGLGNFARKAALGAWMATQAATAMPMPTGVSVPVPIGQEHGNAAERIENEKKNRKDLLKNKIKKNVGSPPNSQDHNLNSPSLPIR
jgi:hypothetical protein